MSGDLYQERLKDLASRDSPVLERVDASARADNPLCGDRVDLDLRLDDGQVVALGHQVRGCLLCKAAAALAAERAPGLDAATAAGLADGVSAMLKQGAAPPFAGLEPFLPVREHKSRHDCVLLPFKALAKALASRLA